MENILEDSYNLPNDLKSNKKDNRHLPPVNDKEVLDILNEIFINFENNLKFIEKNLNFLQHHKRVCEKLHSKFPTITFFKEALEEINNMVEDSKDIINLNRTTLEKIEFLKEIINAQDIKHQKVIKAISILEMLVEYMDNLCKNKNVIDQKDIEILIEKFGVLK